MKKLLIILFTFTALSASKAQNVFVADNPSSIKFYSDAPVADVAAETKSVTGGLNMKTGDVKFRVDIKSFHFDNAKMEEHFNENYMESDKYPTAEFDGQLPANTDLSKEGQFNVKISGKMTIHGVTKDVTMDGTITVKDGKMYAYSKFKVKVADYNITVPSAVSQHIAENIDVTVNLTMVPYNK